MMWSRPRRGLGQHYWDGRSSGIVITRDGMGQTPFRRYPAMAPRVRTPQVGPWGRRAVRPPFRTPSGRPLMGLGKDPKLVNGNGNGNGNGPVEYESGLVTGPIGLFVGTGTGAALGALLGRVMYQGKGTAAETNKYERGFSALGAFATLAGLALSNKRSTGAYFPNEQQRRAYSLWADRRELLRRRGERGELLTVDETFKPKPKVLEQADVPVRGVRAPGDPGIGVNLIASALDAFDRAVSEFQGEIPEDQMVRHQARIVDALERVKGMVPGGEQVSPDLAAMSEEARRVAASLQRRLDADEGQGYK